MHSGLQGNIEAEKYAKEIAYKLHKGYVLAPINVSIKTAFNISKDIAMRSWQRMWVNEHSGRYILNLITSVNSKVLFPLYEILGYPIAGFCFGIQCSKITVSGQKLLILQRVTQEKRQQSTTYFTAVITGSKGKRCWISYFNYVIRTTKYWKFHEVYY